MNEKEFKIRLDKFLVDTFVGTRKQVKTLIKQKRVKVNQKIITNPDFNVFTKEDEVCLDDKVLTFQEHYYFILNKPSGYVCAKEDNINQTIMELFKSLPSHLVEKLFPVGRLDKDTEGLLIVTTDGIFNHLVSSPTHHIQKTYYVEYEEQLLDNACEILAKGLKIKNKSFLTSKLEHITKNSCYLTICEGKFHQVKKMIHQVGGVVTYLKREKIGELVLPQNLALGEFLEMKQDDIYRLMKIYKKGN